jgi:uncharacterized protein (TIGR02172 family)
MLQTLIGRGLTSEVYAWGDGLVVKLYPSWRAVSDIERECAVARAVHAAGMPVPAVHGMVEVEGRRGVVFERVEGTSMLKHVEKRPWTLFRAARQLAELHAQLHRCPAPPELPSQRRQLESWIDAATDCSESERQAARLCLRQLPDGNALCHGDFHPENILLTARGPMIIDWSSGTRGHPLADVGFTSLLFRKANLPADTLGAVRLLFKVSRRLLHRAYLSRYLRLRPGTRQQIEAWIPVLNVAVAAWRIQGMAQLHQPGGLPL